MIAVKFGVIVSRFVEPGHSLLDMFEAFELFNFVVVSIEVIT